MRPLPFWILPVVSAVFWLTIVLTLLGTWLVDGKPVYESMTNGQTIPFISDVGADRLKPLFITMCTITVIVFDTSLVLDRWLRHRGVLARATSTSQKVLAVLGIVSAIFGGIGLILLTICDTLRYPKLHISFLALFVGGHIFSALFICIQYQRMGAHHPDIRLLRLSFWIKLVFIIPEFFLAVAFGVLGILEMYTAAAAVEWVIAILFSFFLLSFAVDFIPMTETEKEVKRQTMSTKAMMSSTSLSSGSSGHDSVVDGNV